MTAIETTHAGSLPRPRDVADALSGEYADGTRGPDLEERVAAATAEVVARQVELGLDIVNNGELGRESFFTYVQHRMTGFGGHAPRRPMQDLARRPSYLERLARRRGERTRVDLLDPPRAVGEVAYVDSGAIEAECAQLVELLAGHGLGPDRGFVSSPSPGIVAAAMENAFYPSLADYVEAVGAALAHEYRAIVDAGLTLQIDAPDLAMERHTLFQDRPLDDFLAFVDVVLTTIDGALGDVDRGRVRLHVCWGNYEGPHDCDVPLDAIVDRLLDARFGGLLLSMANPRHAHEHRVFRDHPLPEGTTLVVGVIDTTTNYIEHPEVVADRIERVVDIVGDPARVMAGTDCGFETSAGTTAVAEELVWEKLRSLVDGAAIASARLG